MADNKLAFIGREYNPVWDTDNREVKEFNLNLKQPPLYLDFNKKKHTAIFSKSGGGKSYLLRVLAEEAQRTIGNYAVVMIDPMGLFSTLVKPNTNQAELDAWNKRAPEKIQPDGMKNFKVWVPAGDKENFTKNMYHEVFSLKASELSSGTLCFVFEMKYLGPQANLYRKASRKVAKQNKDYSLGDLIDYIHEHAESDLHFKTPTIDALVTKLDALEELGIITPAGISLDRMIKEGQVTVFDLSMSNAYTARILVHFLAEKCLPLRKKIWKMVEQAQVDEALIDKPSWYIPPMQFIVDEARAYLPGSPALCECLVKGRNCGLLVTAVSQSLNLDEDLYANLTQLFIGPLNFEKDIATVRRMVPFAKGPAEFRNAIKELQTGCFMYYNTDTKLEKRIRVRPSHTLHPASSELLDERKYFKGANPTPQPASPPIIKPAPVPVPTQTATSLVGPGAPVQTKKEALDPILFSEDYPKLQKPVYSTIRRHDKNYQINQIRPIILKGIGIIHNAKIIRKHFKTLPELDTTFLEQDTNRPTREAAITLLNSFYEHPIAETEKLCILGLERIN